MREHVLTLFRKNGVNGVGCNQASIERLSEILILFRFGFTAKDLEEEIESHCGCMVSRHSDSLWTRWIRAISLFLFFKNVIESNKIHLIHVLFLAQ